MYSGKPWGNNISSCREKEYKLEMVEVTRRDSGITDRPALSSLVFTSAIREKKLLIKILVSCLKQSGTLFLSCMI